MLVVPDPSERWQVTMGVLGNDLPGFSAAMAGSFQVVIVPRTFGDHIAGQMNMGRDPRHVVCDADGSRDGRNVQDAGRGFHFGIVHGRVGRAEVYGFGGDVFNAAAGTDGLVVDGDACFLLVFLEPLLIQRRRERRPRPVQSGPV